MDDTMMNFSDNVDEFIPQLSSPEGLHEIERQRDENKRLVSEISEVKEKLQASTTQLKVEQQKLKKFGEQMEDTRDKHSRELQRLQQTIEQRNIIFQDELRIDLSKQDAERQKNLEITHQQALRQVTSENNGLRIAAHNMRESEVAAVSDMKDELAQLKVTNQIKQKRDEEKRRTEIAQVESENDKLKDEAKKVKQDLEQLKLDNRIEKMQREDTHMKAVAQIRSDNAALIKTSFTAPIVYDQGLLQMVEGVFAAPPSRSVAVKYWRSTTKSVDTPGAPVKADADLNTIAIMHRLNDDDYNHFLEDFRVRIKNEKNYRLVTARDRIELHVTLGTEKTQPWTYARYADVERFEFPQNIVENMVAYKAIESKPNAPSVLKRRRRFSDQLELEFVELRDEVETKDEQEEREVAMASQSKGQILGRKRVVGKEYRQSLRSVQPLKGRVTALASKENLKKVRSYGRPTKKSKEPEKSRQAIQEDDPMLETTSSQIDAVFNQFSSSFTQFDRSQL
jgi:hypothetical protein